MQRVKVKTTGRTKGPASNAPLEGPDEAEPAGLDDGLDYLIRTLRRRQVELIERLLQQLDLPLGAWYPLIVLGRGDGMSQRDLGKRLGLKDAGIGKSIDNLERSGLLRRVPDAEDRRKFLILLTPKGRKLAQQVTMLREQVLQTLHKGFTRQEEETFRALLLRAHANLVEFGDTALASLAQPTATR